jgi:hypothetical protein
MLPVLRAGLLEETDGPGQAARDNVDVVQKNPFERLRRFS